MHSQVKHFQQIRKVQLIKFNPNRQNSYTRTSWVCVTWSERCAISRRQQDRWLHCPVCDRELVNHVRFPIYHLQGCWQRCSMCDRELVNHVLFPVYHLQVCWQCCSLTGSERCAVAFISPTGLLATLLCVPGSDRCAVTFISSTGLLATLICVAGILCAVAVWLACKYCGNQSSSGDYVNSS